MKRLLNLHIFLICSWSVIIFCIQILHCSCVFAQSSPNGEFFTQFTQRMNFALNDTTWTMTGNGETSFVNSSNDTLTSIFFHAHFNAFQPGSALYENARQTGSDMKERIDALKPEQWGKLEITSAEFSIGKPVMQRVLSIERFGTIIRIDLSQPLKPQEKLILRWQATGTIPPVIRRTGHSNSQKIAFSMAHWYPKLCQYDAHGWQNNQHVGREFYGIFGTYDVRLTLPTKYIVGASGVLQNPQEVGHGYQFLKDTTVLPASPLAGTLSWHFIAENVHDFAWVADSNYAHQIKIHKLPTGDTVQIHSLFKSGLRNSWAQMGNWCGRTIDFFSKNYGMYPYKTFTSAQAGDGGMEYPTLIMISHSDPYNLLRVTVHELGHQWFFGLVANNETKHAWMDEGFTKYIETRAMREEFSEVQRIPASWLRTWLVPQRTLGYEEHRSFHQFSHENVVEPLSTPHDKFSDGALSALVYYKGSAILRMLEYAFGKEKANEAIKKYALRWRFHHPYPHDFEKSCEDVFGERLDEVFDGLLLSPSLPDYSFTDFQCVNVNNLWKNSVSLSNNSSTHIPLMLFWKDKSGKTGKVHIPAEVPLRSINNKNSSSYVTTSPWFWSQKEFSAEFYTENELELVKLDSAGLLLDQSRSNNIFRNRFFLPTIPEISLGLWTRYDQATPNDVYGVSVRPSVWYSATGGVQVGFRADGSHDFADDAVTFGLYYNSTNSRLDWQFGYSDYFRALGTFASWNAKAFSMDGLQGFSASISKQIRIGYYSSPQKINLKLEAGWRKWDWAFAPNFSQENEFLSQTQPNGKQEISLSEFGFMKTSAQYQWKNGEVSATLSALGNEHQSGILGQISSTIDVVKKSGFSLQLRGFSSAAHGTVPLSALPSLRSVSALSQFENTPFRLVAGLAGNERSISERLLLPSVLGVARGSALPSNVVLGTGFSLQQQFNALGISTPVISALKIGLYGGIGFSGETIQVAKDYVAADAGATVSVNLSDISRDIDLLWMFSEPVSVSVYFPFVEKNPINPWRISTNGVWIGISSSL